MNFNVTTSASTLQVLKEKIIARPPPSPTPPQFSLSLNFLLERSEKICFSKIKNTFQKIIVIFYSHLNLEHEILNLLAKFRNHKQ